MSEGDENKEYVDKLFRQLFSDIDKDSELRKGVHLCRLLLMFNATIIPPPIEKSSTEVPWALGRKEISDNLENFLNGCRRYGMLEADLFKASDLLNRINQKNIYASIVKLIKLALNTKYFVPKTMWPPPPGMSKADMDLDRLTLRASQAVGISQPSRPAPPGISYGAPQIPFGMPPMGMPPMGMPPKPTSRPPPLPQNAQDLGQNPSMNSQKRPPPPPLARQGSFPMPPSSAPPSLPYDSSSPGLVRPQFGLPPSMPPQSPPQSNSPVSIPPTSMSSSPLSSLSSNPPSGSLSSSIFSQSQVIQRVDLDPNFPSSLQPQPITSFYSNLTASLPLKQLKITLKSLKTKQEETEKKRKELNEKFPEKGKAICEKINQDFNCFPIGDKFVEIALGPICRKLPEYLKTQAQLSLNNEFDCMTEKVENAFLMYQLRYQYLLDFVIESQLEKSSQNEVEQKDKKRNATQEVFNMLLEQYDEQNPEKSKFIKELKKVGDVYGKTVKEVVDKLIVKLESDDSNEVDLVKFRKDITQCLPEGGASKPSDSIEDLPVEPGFVFEFKQGKVQIKGGDTRKLIERIATSEERDYHKIFFLNYKSFSQPDFVLTHLLSIFERSLNEVNDDSASAVFNCGNALKHWFTCYTVDFVDNPVLLGQLKSFIDKNASKDSNLNFLRFRMDEYIQKEKERKNGKVILRRQLVKIPDISPASVPLSMDSSASGIHIDFIDPVEIARQLTLIEYNLYMKIRPQECLGCAWSKKDKEVTSPNILAMTKRFNQVSNWVSFTIVDEESFVRRTNLVRKFVRTALALFDLGNLNGVFEICSGLNSAAITRLKKSWDVINKEKEKSLFSSLCDVISTSFSYSRYREELVKRKESLCIPYPGVFLQDLTFIEDGNKTFLDESKCVGLIPPGEQYPNFSKCRMVHDVIAKLLDHQHKVPNLQRLQPVIEFLEKVEGRDDKECYDLSLVVEPREK
eukprot:TRINITY_DN480_c0_g1_i1.p1 TRINITY_DN480_c0_g1~~TRINITY_DN480_c0_g1_i1.p1  ORF type:complete len:966 (-),score=285.56 TRINITY_DN480_c0_g1_i1:142-3039(-)